VSSQYNSAAYVGINIAGYFHKIFLKKNVFRYLSYSLFATLLISTPSEAQNNPICFPRFAESLAKIRDIRERKSVSGFSKAIGISQTFNLSSNISFDTVNKIKLISDLVNSNKIADILYFDEIKNLDLFLGKIDKDVKTEIISETIDLILSPKDEKSNTGCFAYLKNNHNYIIVNTKINESRYLRCVASLVFSNVLDVSVYIENKNNINLLYEFLNYYKSNDFLQSYDMRRVSVNSFLLDKLDSTCDLRR
jgi:hypothetical protein